MAWMIARDDSENLTHYGVKGMKWKRSKVGTPSNYSRAVVDKNAPSPYGPVDKLNRPTHGSLAGVPSNLKTMGRISFNRTNGSRYAGKNEDGDTIYRTTALQVKATPQAGPVRRLNTGFTRQGSAAAIQRRLRSNRRYKASRAGMPSYVRM